MKARIYEIDPFVKFPLATSVVGLIEKITSPKGIRKQEESGRYSYKFTSDEFWIYKNIPLDLESGIYKVLNICQRDAKSCWDNYLFIVDDFDGRVYPIAEYLDCPDTLWVKDALDLVKQYFAGEQIAPIKLTDLKPKKEKKSGWIRAKK